MMVVLHSGTSNVFFFPAISQSLAKSKVSVSLIYFHNNVSLVSMCLNLNLQFLYSSVLLRFYLELMQMMHLTQFKNGEKSVYVCHLMNKFISSLWRLLLVVCVMLLALQTDTNALMTAWDITGAPPSISSCLYWLGMTTHPSIHFTGCQWWGSAQQDLNSCGVWVEPLGPTHHSKPCMAPPWGTQWRGDRLARPAMVPWQDSLVAHVQPQRSYTGEMQETKCMMRVSSGVSWIIVVFIKATLQTILPITFTVESSDDFANLVDC